MRKILILLTILFAGTCCNAQILKDLSRRITNDAESKVEQKVSSKMDQGLDSLTKKKGKTKRKKSNTATTVGPSDSAAINVPATQSNNGASTQTISTTVATSSISTVTPQNGQSDPNASVNFQIFPKKILTGGTVSITGTSVKHGDLTDVAMTIVGPSTNETKKISMKDNSSFSTNWQAKGAGTYTITIKSSDGKSSQSESFDVFRLVQMDLITGPNKEETKKAFDKFKEITGIVQQELTPKDAEDLQKRVSDVTAKKDKLLKVFDDLDEMGKGLDNIEQKYGSIPQDVSKDLIQVDSLLSQQADQMQQANAMADHKPYDNSICEYLTMVKEICAAFSTVTNFWSKSLGGILKNIAIDKAVPAATGAHSVGLSPEGDDVRKECAKVAVTAEFDAESFTSTLGAAGFTGDIVQMCSDHFLRQYCVVLSGDLKHDYKCIFRNRNSQTWWQYNYTTEATITLRYPKNNQGGSVIKMKGNIEGNATKFDIFQDVNQMDDFQDKIKNRAQAFSYCLWSPPFVPFASSKADKNVGFGAIARAVVTPAYFNIPIDADYDIANKKLMLYLNDPIVDFSTQVYYKYGYLVIAAMIPLTTVVNFPINKAKLTLNKVIEQNNGFNVVSDSKDNVSVGGKGSWQIGQGASIEQHINFNFSMKNE